MFDLGVQALFNYGGVVLGLLGIGATIYFAIRYAERKAPQLYAVTERRIAISQEAPQDIEIHFRGARVKRVSSTTVWIWNDGTKPIVASDIPSTQTLVLDLVDGEEPVEILDVTVRKTTRPAINFAVHRRNESSVTLTFDFLDHGDGACFELQHTGSVRTHPKMAGVILGVPRGVRVREATGVRGADSLVLMGALLRLPTRPRRRRRRFVARLLASTMLLVLLGGVSYFFVVSRNDLTIGVAQLRSALEPYVSGPILSDAVGAVEGQSKFKMLNRIGPYVICGFLLLNIFVALYSLWRRPHPFPVALLPDDSPQPPEMAAAPSPSERSNVSNSSHA